MLWIVEASFNQTKQPTKKQFKKPTMLSCSFLSPPPPPPQKKNTHTHTHPNKQQQQQQNNNKKTQPTKKRFEWHTILWSGPLLLRPTNPRSCSQAPFFFLGPQTPDPAIRPPSSQAHKPQILWSGPLLLRPTNPRSCSQAPFFFLGPQTPDPAVRPPSQAHKPQILQSGPLLLLCSVQRYEDSWHFQCILGYLGVFD